jgi:hypothetical protein
MNQLPVRLLALPLLMLTVACGDSRSPVDPSEVALAKGGNPEPQKVEFTITSGNSLAGDGKGVYRDGVCGVLAGWSDLLHLAPAGTKIPKSQQAACAGIAPRAASLTLAVRHLSDDPHVDDEPTAAVYPVQNVKFGFGAAAATTINASPSCGTLGLRFTSVTFPGSSDVVREDLGGGLWHMYTRPWPDNKGYCENGGIVTYWHVSMDIMVQKIGS